MNQNDLDKLLQSLKALGDENRLRIIAYLSRAEHNVGSLAELLGVSEPTVSHHLTKLREAGFVNLRTHGNQRFYCLNDGTIRRTSQQVTGLQDVDMDAIPANWDNAWIDAVEGLDADERKVLKDYILNGKLTQIPVKRKKLLAVLHWLATLFDEGIMYTESEVNEIIVQYHDDYATLRRELIDFGFLRRERGGGKYWVAPEEEGSPA
ncbi:MAG: ArsR family transcriptional regulator [Anaerolineaceae bacterium]|nr:ArsR family transcriptional regulator [Anaerolineaceae bacterium]